MRTGWIGSIVTHALIAAATLVAWPDKDRDLPAPSAIVPVDIIIGEVTNVSAIAPPPPEDPAEEAELAPEGAPQSMAPPTPEAPEAINDPRQKQKKKEEPRRPVTDLNDIAALIDRSKKEQGQAASSSDAETGPNARNAAGAGTEVTASEADAIRSAIERNRQKFVDLPDYERLRVTIQIRLNADGSLAEAPRVLRTSLPASDPYMRVAIDRSLRAILTSEPLPVAPDRTRRATFTINFYDR